MNDPRINMFDGPKNPRHPMFRDHRCWKCNDGERPCAQTRPGVCEYPHARND